MRRRSTAQKGLALALAAAVLAAVPARTLLDASVPDQGSHLEASHDPTHCGYLHDHDACHQLFASSASPAPGVATAGPRPPAATRLTSPATEPSDRRTPSSTLPRAPPPLRS